MRKVPLIFFSTISALLGFAIGQLLGTMFVIIFTIIGFIIPSILVVDKIYQQVLGPGDCRKIDELQKEQKM
ncbi:hypothetical protein GJ688_00020 [Heliobacillus mobilis]|uniref:Uncharacterized protein n=1 Tax=Heliobacterium mobile TaxID=28064 RepID=A0A6I3SBA8_HELMO|nr:hypothetical protein [Heliobacterium mobile]